MTQNHVPLLLPLEAANLPAARVKPHARLDQQSLTSNLVQKANRTRRMKMASQKKKSVIRMKMGKKATRAPTVEKIAKWRRMPKRRREAHGAQERGRPNPSRRIRRLPPAQ